METPLNPSLQALGEPSYSLRIGTGGAAGEYGHALLNPLVLLGSGMLSESVLVEV